jgi:hypothetical protein
LSWTIRATFASAATSNVFLTVQRIERDEMAGDAELSEQGLHGRDLVGFVGNVDMGKHKGGVGGECAEHLGGGAVIEVVEAAAQRLAIEGNAGLSGPCACGLQKGGMAAEDLLDRIRVEPLKNVADGSMSGRAAPAQSEERVQAAAMDVDEGDDSTIRSCSRSRRRGWKTAARRAACTACPPPGADQELPPASPTAARMQPRQPPIRLPPQESDIWRFGNPHCHPPPRFGSKLLHFGLTSAAVAALNSRGD